MDNDLPRLALSVRQPWAWAIIHAGKDVENRSLGAIRAGRMALGRIALHAASGMTRKEYDWAVWRMAQDGVTVPRPEDLPRRAIIGAVDVVEIVTASDSPWFGGKAGLRLSRPCACAPVPAAGALGYFEWRAEGDLSAPAPWMTKWGGGGRDDLFGGLPPQFATPPQKPFDTGRSKRRSG